MSGRARRLGYKQIDPNSLPDVKTTDKNKKLAAVQPFTVANYKHIVNALGYRLRYNIMSGEAEVWEQDGREALPTDAAFQVFETIDDALVWLRISTARAFNVRGVVATEDTYHPMCDWIDSIRWDGRDRLAALAATVPTDTELWPLYLRKWLIQLMEAVCGWDDNVERSLPHVLTFTGAQGLNKGRWIRALGGERFVTADAELHLGGGGQKDSLLEVLSKPIAELGEIDATFKVADVSALKSFLSRPVDSIRRPYARNPVIRQRMTCFMGSVNRLDFLVDATGSRRFWPVAVREGEKLIWDHGIDMGQVFAQAQALWAGGEDWNLSDEDDLKRALDARRFSYVPAIADLANAHWLEYKNDSKDFGMLNRTEIARVIGGSMQPVQLRELGDWLLNTLGPGKNAEYINRQGVKVLKQRCWAWPGVRSFGYQTIPETVVMECLKETRKWTRGQLKLVVENEPEKG